MIDTIFKKGDLLLPGAPAGKRGYISNKILESTQSGPEDPSRVSHAMIVLVGGKLEDVWVIEMTFPRLRIVRLIDHYSESFIVWYRPKYATSHSIDLMLAELKSREGRAMPSAPFSRYSWTPSSAI